MSSVYVILAVMLLLNPAHKDEPDVLEILSVNGKPLHFKTIEECSQHIEENGFEIARFEIEEFMPKPVMVRGIICVNKQKALGVRI